LNWETLRIFGYEGTLESASSDHEGLFPARVVEQQKNGYRTITPSGFMSARVSGKWSFSAQHKIDYPAVGDWVLADLGQDRATIHRILPRHGVLERKSPGLTSEGQIIATNLEGVFVCMSTDENFNLRRLERYLTVAWSSGAIPFVVLTKSDLAKDLKSLLRMAESVSFGTEVITATEIETHGFDEIKRRMRHGKTYAFIGSSGVGKSTIVNHLLGATLLSVSEVGASGKGRHTTTSRQMFVTPEGAIVIDTPGMRELQLDSGDFSSAFADLERLASSCRFSDCTHRQEPGCAVRAAIRAGIFPEERLENYRKMQKEMAYQEERAKYARLRGIRGAKRHR